MEIDHAQTGTPSALFLPAHDHVSPSMNAAVEPCGLTCPALEEAEDSRAAKRRKLDAYLAGGLPPGIDYEMDISPSNDPGYVGPPPGKTFFSPLVSAFAAAVTTKTFAKRGNGLQRRPVGRPRKYPLDAPVPVQPVQPFQTIPVPLPVARTSTKPATVPVALAPTELPTGTQSASVKKIWTSFVSDQVSKSPSMRLTQEELVAIYRSSISPDPEVLAFLDERQSMRAPPPNPPPVAPSGPGPSSPRAKPILPAPPRPRPTVPSASEPPLPPIPAEGSPLVDCERQLCKDLQLNPLLFAAYRDVLLLDNRKRGRLHKTRARNLLPELDPEKVRKLYDALWVWRWITRPNFRSGPRVVPDASGDVLAPKAAPPPTPPRQRPKPPAPAVPALPSPPSRPSPTSLPTALPILYAPHVLDTFAAPFESPAPLPESPPSIPTGVDPPSRSSTFRPSRRTIDRDSAPSTPTGPSGTHHPYPKGGRARPAPLDIRAYPGYDDLTDRERELCSLWRIQPLKFKEVRDLMVKESDRDGGLRKRRAREMISWDVLKTAAVWEALAEWGVIKPLRDTNARWKAADGEIKAVDGEAGTVGREVKEVDGESTVAVGSEKSREGDSKPKGVEAEAEELGAGMQIDGD